MGFFYYFKLVFFFQLLHYNNYKVDISGCNPDLKYAGIEGLRQWPIEFNELKESGSHFFIGIFCHLLLV